MVVGITTIGTVPNAPVDRQVLPRLVNTAAILLEAVPTTVPMIGAHVPAERILHLVARLVANHLLAVVELVPIGITGAVPAEAVRRLQEISAPVSVVTAARILTTPRAPAKHTALYHRLHRVVAPIRLAVVRGVVRGLTGARAVVGRAPRRHQGLAAILHRADVGRAILIMDPALAGPPLHKGATMCQRRVVGQDSIGTRHHAPAARAVPHPHHPRPHHLRLPEVAPAQLGTIG